MTETRRRLIAASICLALFVSTVALWAQTANVARFAKIVATAAAGDAFVVPSGGAVIGTATDPSAQTLDVRSSSDDLGSGFRISRADANSSYFIQNMNSGSAYATMQAGNGAAWLPIKINPSGGGMSVGDGVTVVKILSATASWDPNLIQVDGGFETITLTMTGVANSSTCFASFTAALASDIVLSARYDTTNTVRATLMNPNTGSTYDPGSGTVRVTCFIY